MAKLNRPKVSATLRAFGESVIPVLYANAIAADAGLIPGLAIFGPALGLPVSVLAAFIERPFVTRAGVEKNAIWFSLQANFVSLLAGYVATVVAIPLAMGPNMLYVAIWPILAIAISMVTERQYLSWRLSNGVARWAPIVVGNIVSAATCIAVMVFVAVLREAVPQLREELRDYEMTMNLAAAAGSLVLLAGSFLARNPSATPRQVSEPLHSARLAAAPVSDEDLSLPAG